MAQNYAKNVQDLTVERKADQENSPVTEADRAIDALLKDILCNAQPDYGWLSEESEDDPNRLNKEAVWIVDSIDGTNAFIRGSNDFAISAALAVDGAVVAGAVCLPMRNTIITATAKGGVQIIGADLPQWTPQACLLSFHEYRDGDDEQKMFLPEWELVPFASAAAKMALVGAGAAGATVQRRPKSEWDVAAGDIICRAAGLKVSDVFGAPFSYNKQHPNIEGVVVTNSAMHKAVLDLLPNGTAEGYRF